jgi:hypothetical protein
MEHQKACLTDAAPRGTHNKTEEPSDGLGERRERRRPKGTQRRLFQERAILSAFSTNLEVNVAGQLACRVLAERPGCPPRGRQVAPLHSSPGLLNLH